MGLKKFLKPSLGIILLMIILIIITYVFVPLPSNCNEEMVWHSILNAKLIKSCYPVSLAYSLFGILIIISYIISCAIVRLFKK